MASTDATATGDPYVFVLAAAGLALAVDPQTPQGGLVVRPRAPDSEDAILWELRPSGPGLVALVNKLSGLAAAAPNDYAQVQQVPATSLDGSSTWSIVGDMWQAIRPARNTDMNLNVAGNGPYALNNTVLAWDWDGGQPNEVWQLLPVTF